MATIAAVEAREALGVLLIWSAVMSFVTPEYAPTNASVVIGDRYRS